MAKWKNTIEFERAVVRDAEVKVLQNGSKLVEFSVIFPKSVWNAETKAYDKKPELTGFLKVKSFKEDHIAKAKLIKQGALIYVKGELDFNVYQKDGKRIQEVIISPIEINLVNQDNSYNTQDNQAEEDKSDTNDDIPW